MDDSRLLIIFGTQGLSWHESSSASHRVLVVIQQRVFASACRGLPQGTQSHLHKPEVVGMVNEGFRAPMINLLNGESALLITNISRAGVHCGADFLFDPGVHWGPFNNGFCQCLQKWPRRYSNTLA